MHRQQAAVQAAVRADVGNVLSIAGSIEDDPSLGHGRIPGQPIVVQVGQIGLAVHVRFVEDFEVRIFVAAVFVDHGLPHGPPRVHVPGLVALGAVPVAEHEHALGKHGVDGARIGGPERRDRGLVDGDPDGVGAQLRNELRHDGVAHGEGRIVGVGRREPRDVEASRVPPCEPPAARQSKGAGARAPYASTAREDCS